MDIIIEIIIDFIETIFINNSEKIVKDKKISKFIRYPVIFIALLLCGLLTLGPIILGIFLLKQNTIGAIIFILIGTIFSMCIFYEIKKVINKQRKK